MPVIPGKKYQISHIVCDSPRKAGRCANTPLLQYSSTPASGFYLRLPAHIHSWYLEPLGNTPNIQR